MLLRGLPEHGLERKASSTLMFPLIVSFALFHCVQFTRVFVLGQLTFDFSHLVFTWPQFVNCVDVLLAEQWNQLSISITFTWPHLLIMLMCY